MSAARAAEPMDGRGIDPARGALVGEGAGIRVEAPDHAYPTIREIARRTPAPSRGEESTYYDEPVLKAPVWTWSVPLYFFVGGAAGGAAALAAAAQALDPRGLRRLVRRAHLVSAIGDVLGAGLLVYDLGRPSRFLDMLRVFRPTSPMSVGSWVLTASGATSTLSALPLGDRGVAGSARGAAGYASGVLGLALAGYTGVLLSNTAVPVWQGGRRALPPLFLASSAASAGALLHLLPVGRRGRVVARRFALAGGVAEVVLALAYEREVASTPRAARPLRRGASGGLFSLSTALSRASVIVRLVARRDGKRAGALADALGLAGALGLRAAVFLAGKASARDPRATFRQQRDALARAGAPAPEAARHG